jgi:hypothetical protein
MAKAFALKRSTGQPVTINTVEATATDLGTVITGVQTAAPFPARCVNIYTVFQGNPLILVVSAVGDIEVHQLIAGTWSVVAGPFSPLVGHVLTPICLQIVNDTVVALWSDEAGAGDGISVSSSTDGTTWSTPLTELAVIGASNGGDSIVYRGAIWFATAIGLWSYAPLARFITLAGIVGAYTAGETVTGSVSLTTGVVRSFSGSLLRIDTVSGTGFAIGDVVTGLNSGATGNFSSSTSFVNAAPDTGSDTFLTGASGSANLLGSFASWDGNLYFMQPKTVNGPIRIYSLDASWEAPLVVPAPQWTAVIFTGVGDVGIATVSGDAGMWSMFVNKTDDLCLFYSGSGSTKLAKTTSKLFPLSFLDLTNTILPSAIAAKTSLGITLYTDDRRRDNILQTLLIRDLNAGTTLVTSWDGASALVEEGIITGSDFLLPATRTGEGATFTNLQPTVHITSAAQPFPGRVRIDYIVKADPARTVGILPEYSIDGDQYFPMTQGDADSGVDSLAATPSGDPYFFNWDTFADLDGDFDNLLLRIVDRITGV